MGKDRIKQLNTILVDFDGTLNVNSWPGAITDPQPEAVQFMADLIRRGYKVLIFTSRAWQGWVQVGGQEFYDAQYRQMVDWLARWKISYHGITCVKEPSLLIVDDRAVNPREKTWDEILEWLDSNDEYGKIGLGMEFKIKDGRDA